MIYKNEFGRAIVVYPFSGHIKDDADKVKNLYDFNIFIINLLKKYKISKDERIGWAEFDSQIIISSKDIEFHKKLLKTWFPYLSLEDIISSFNPYTNQCRAEFFLNNSDRGTYRLPICSFNGGFYMKDLEYEDNHRKWIPIYAFLKLKELQNFIEVYDNESIAIERYFHYLKKDEFRNRNYLNVLKGKAVEIQSYINFDKFVFSFLKLKFKEYQSLFETPDTLVFKSITFSIEQNNPEKINEFFCEYLPNIDYSFKQFVFSRGPEKIIVGHREILYYNYKTSPFWLIDKNGKSVASIFSICKCKEISLKRYDILFEQEEWEKKALEVKGYADLCKLALEYLGIDDKESSEIDITFPTALLKNVYKKLVPFDKLIETNFPNYDILKDIHWIKDGLLPCWEDRQKISSDIFCNRDSVLLVNRNLKYRGGFWLELDGEPFLPVFALEPRKSKQEEKPREQEQVDMKIYIGKFKLIDYKPNL